MKLLVEITKEEEEILERFSIICTAWRRADPRKKWATDERRAMLRAAIKDMIRKTAERDAGVAPLEPASPVAS